MWVHTADENQVACQAQRRVRYVRDGDCVSARPLKEHLCTGQCLPAQLLHNWTGSQNFWRRRHAVEWRCTSALSHVRRVRLRCADGRERMHRVHMATGCACRRMERDVNLSAPHPFIRLS